jgi:thiamine pyrophosphate-dependent acetolactate synthase large subunit-like protein
VDSAEALEHALVAALADPLPTLLDIPTPSEEEVMPPVAAWKKQAHAD